MFGTLRRLTVLILTALLTAPSLAAAAQNLTLTTQLVTDIPINGISTTPEGRVFYLYARIDGSKGPVVVEWIRSNNTFIPYPNYEWNNYTQGKDVATHYVRINAQRIGPDGHLYLVDVGSPGFGQPVIKNAVKLIQIDLSTNNVSRIYHLDNVTLPDSLLDDVRFNGPVAYLTDAGVPGLIVLDRETGAARRVLNNTHSAQGYFPLSAEGKFLYSPLGGYEYIYIDQLEVSPDGKWLYYQAGSGCLWRMNTTHLTNTSLTDAQLDALAEPHSLTPSTGGTAIDAQGNVYNSDVNFQRIVKTAPNGTMSILFEDPRLLWVDAMWVDTQGRLWMPVCQLNRGIPFNNGTNKIVPPLYIFTVDIGIGPSPIDHA